MEKTVHYAGIPCITGNKKAPEIVTYTYTVKRVTCKACLKKLQSPPKQ